MIINWENDDSQPFSKVYDANGLEWTECLEVDTEAGRIERLVTDAAGKPMLTDDGTELRRETIMAAAPILVVPEAAA